MSLHLKTRLYRIWTFSALLSVVVSLLGISMPVLASPRGSEDDLRIDVDPETGKVTFIGADPAAAFRLPETALDGVAAEDLPMRYLEHFGDMLGLRAPARELQVMRQRVVRGGERTSTRYQQVYKGVPILAGELIVNLDDNGALLSISGEISPELDLSVEPVVTADVARETALGTIAKTYGLQVEDLEATPPKLWIFDERLLLSSARPPELVWRMDVHSADAGLPIDELVLIDAERGGVSLHFNQIDTSWGTFRQGNSGLKHQADEATPTGQPELDPTPTAQIVPTQEASQAPPTPEPTPTGEPTTVPTAAPTQPPFSGGGPTPTAPPQVFGSDGVASNEPFTGFADGTTYYVKPGGNDGLDCLSPATACASLYSTVLKATSGDTIRVAVGEYTDNGDFVVALNRDLLLSGGWDEDFNTRSGFSFIDGQNARRGIIIYSGITAEIEYFRVENGYSGNVGSGILNSANSLTIRNCILTNNISGMKGGGIYHYSGILKIEHSEISNNHSADTAGAIIVVGGVVEIRNSTISGNSSNASAGGIFNAGVLTLNNVTMANNNAADHGGALISGAGGSVTMSNTLLADNTATVGPNCTAPTSIISLGYNIIEDVSDCGYSLATGDITGTDPGLLPLTGSPAYHTFAPASPLVDAGNPITPGSGGAACEADDQRGVVRPVDGDEEGSSRCDIGAVELSLGIADRIEPVAGSLQRTALDSAFRIPLQAIVIDNFGFAMPGIEVTFSSPLTGASGVFLDTGINETMAITDMNGIATAANLVANNQVGAFEVSATAEGVPTVADFQLENYLAVAESIEVYAGSGQIAERLTAYPAPLQVILKDQFANPYVGGTVSYLAPSSGPSGSFSDSGTYTTIAITNGEGIATASEFIANSEVGSFFVQASFAGVADLALFELTNVLTLAVSVETHSGSPQHTTLMTPFPIALQAIVYSLEGLPLPGKLVTFRAPGSGASGTFSDSGTETTSVVTDSAGIATASIFTANDQIGSYVVSASVEYVAQPAEFLLFNGVSGEWYVNPYGNDANDCLSPITPCATINAAVDKASAGGIIRVKAGEYTGSSEYVVTLTKSVALSGGWNSDFTIQDGFSVINGSNTRKGMGVGTGVISVIEFFSFENGNAVGATGRGGGIYNSGNLTLRNCRITNNSAGFNGGGVYQHLDSLTIESSEISQNISADTGGGILIAGGTVVIRNSTISGNVSNASAGGVFSAGNLTLNNVTVADNSANDHGGGLISGSGGSLTMANTILANNSASVGPDCTSPQPITSLGYNLVGDITDCTYTPASGDLTGVDPELLPLHSFPAYHPIRSTSPVVDAGNPATPGIGGDACESSDQRGVSRPVDGDGNGSSHCDIGAVEYSCGTADSLEITAGSGQNAPILTSFPVQFQVRVMNTFGLPMEGAIVTFSAPATGPSGTFVDSGMNNAQAVTNIDGIATASEFAANDQVGAYTVSASVEGLTGSVQFDLENYVPVATDMEVVAGLYQRTQPLTTFPTPLQVLIRDQYNEPLVGGVVTFTAPGSSPSGTFADSGTNVTTAITGIDGIATASGFTADNQEGSYTILAEVEGVADPAAFYMNNTIDSLWFVKLGGDDSDLCWTVDTACATIDAVLNKPYFVPGETIKVAVGTYTGTGEDVVVVDADAELSGGWDSTFSTQIGYSTIDGEESRRGVKVVDGVDVSIQRFIVENGYVSRYDYYGGGISSRGNITLRSCIIRNNVSGSGAAGLFAYRDMHLIQSAVYNNFADGSHGGGISIYAAEDSVIEIVNSTISGNIAMSAAGIYKYRGVLNIANSTIARNKNTDPDPSAGLKVVGEATLKNTILAENLDYLNDFSDCGSGTLISAGYNLIGVNNGCAISASTGDLIGSPGSPIEALISPMKNVGDDSWVHELLPNSPAIDAGNPAPPGSGGGACESLDQRGVSRPLDGDGDTVAVCDIGAYELDPANSPAEPGDWYVSTLGDDQNSCQDPAAPCATIMGVIEKIGFAEDSTIMVATGTYKGVDESVLWLNEGLTISGGWDEGFTSQVGRAIIDGEQTRSGIRLGVWANANLEGIDIINGHASHGGGIYNAGTLTYSKGDICDNEAFGSGGGLYNARYSHVQLNEVTICRNSIPLNPVYYEGYGAGLYNDGGSVDLEDVTIESNIVDDGHGGGIYNKGFDSDRPNLVILRSSIMYNEADAGAGIYSTGEIVLSETTLFDNHARAHGGGIFSSYTPSTADHVIISNSLISDNGAIVKGGGLYISGMAADLVEIRNTTITSNSSGEKGGGIYATGPTNLSNVTLAFNSSPMAGGVFLNTSEVQLQNSIIARNSSATGPDCTNSSGGPTPSMQSAGYNLIGDMTRCPVLLTTGDITGLDPLLAQLQDHGGSTLAHKPYEGSAAIDAGSPETPGSGGTACEAADQIGTLRPLGVACDIGAIEGFTPTIKLTFTAKHKTVLPGVFLCADDAIICTNGSDRHADGAHMHAQQTYDYYFVRYGRDSLDDNGMEIISTVRYDSGYDNAFWTSYYAQAVYGDAHIYPQVDDIVAHELTHGVTDYESNLFYYYQSGAINESFSDLWGEFVDLTNGTGDDSPGVRWLIGEDLLGVGAIRNMANPPAFEDPDRMTSPYYFTGPADIGYFGDNGGVHTNSGVNNKAVFLLTDGGSFNDYTVAGLGIDKVSAIYYEAQNHLLTSGSDYKDLYHALYQACLNVVGGVEGVTVSDCGEVRKATQAVEMDLEPVTDFNPEAGICPVGQLPVYSFFDDFESGADNWSFVAVSGSSSWSVTSGYAHSGSYMLFGNDWYPSSDSYAVMDPVPLPSGVLSYLHFNHAYGFEDPDYDGGWLEYSVNGGTTWKNMSAWIDEGLDYTGRINVTTGYGDNSHTGRRAFVSDSHGYVSNRYRLTIMGGKNIQLRWRMSTDSSYLDLGWAVDDVRIYTCRDRSEAPVDFDGEGTSEIVVFRNGAWRFFDYDTAVFDHGVWTGTAPGCIPAPMDYDGDGGVEPTQLCDGSWHFYNDDGSYNKGVWTGGVPGDLPVPADYDGDGDDDVVIWRAGAWRFFDFISGTFLNGVWTGSPPHWLGGTSVPVPMDYDGDGQAEFTVWSGGPWHFYNDDGSYNKGIWTGGAAGDLPVPADYDGDGTEEVVVWRAGAWRFFDFNSGAFDHGVWTGAPPHWLGGMSLPAPLDVDGDGNVDFTVFSGGPWHFYNSDGSYAKGIWTGGVAGDLPISRRLLP